MLKRTGLIVFAVLILSLMLALPSEAQQTAVFKIGSSTYIIDGVSQTMDVTPYIKDGRTYLPIRYAGYALGVSPENIFWDSGTATATLIRGDCVVQFTIGDAAMIVNGTRIAIDVPPEIRDGRVMVPLRWIAVAFNAQAVWDAATQTITITASSTPSKETPTPEPAPAPEPEPEPIPVPEAPVPKPEPEPMLLPEPKPVVPLLSPSLHLIADDGKFTYLGKLTTNIFDPDSIFNEFGRYGSKFSPTSIWNEFGTYGSKFSIYSPFNEFATRPPMIVDTNGNILGRLTVNKFIPGAISPYMIYSVLKDLGL